MAKYTIKDIIFFTDDPRLENAIGKKVYASDNPTNILQLARSCMWLRTLVAINKDADSKPFVTYVEGIGYKHYDAIILKKEE